MTTPTSSPRAVARVWGTRHPHVFFLLGAVFGLLFITLGVWLAITRSIPAGLSVVAIGIALGFFVAVPGIWSLRHPDEAGAAVSWNTDRRNALARAHPAYYLIVVPVLAMAAATARLHRDFHRWSGWVWVVIGAFGVAGFVIGVLLVRHARRVSGAVGH